MKDWSEVEGWSYRQAFCKIWIEKGMVYVNIDGWYVDSWYCTAKSEEEFHEQCRNYLKSEQFEEMKVKFYERKRGQA